MGRPNQKAQPVGGSGGELKASDRLGPHMGSPRQEGSECGAAQALLDGPEPVARPRRIDHDDIGQVDAQLFPSVRIEPLSPASFGRSGCFRWGQHDDLALLLSEAGKARCQETQFPDTRGRKQEFSETAGRPATAGQLAIQSGKAARLARGACGHQFVTAPETFAHCGRQGRKGHGDVLNSQVKLEWHNGIVTRCRSGGPSPAEMKGMQHDKGPAAR